MGRGNIRHLSVRVPWHDEGWNGRVCRDARANSACLALKRAAEYRDDPYEETHAGIRFDEVENIPPCLAERGSFLSPFPFALRTRLDYSNYSKEHLHILPQTVHVPAFGGVLTPYRWMLREHAWRLAESHGVDADEAREPKQGEAPDLIVNTAWVQNCDNQQALLDGFGRALAESDTLVFFYAKQTPLTDSGRRQIVAVAKLASLGKVGEYPYEGGSAGGRIRSMVWERPFQHTLRPDPDEEAAWLGGVVLPYHQLLALAQMRPEIDTSAMVAEVPEEAYDQFLFGTDHVTHGAAITSLLAVRASVEAASAVLPGPWARYIDWIDRELSQLWIMQGTAPGLGSALSCFDPNFNGTLFAHALAGELADGADPWPTVEAIMADDRQPPAGSPRITTMQRKRWQHLHRTDPDGARLMRLLACFELTRDQARAAFDGDEVEAILANPYRLYEASRTTADPISLTTVDRSLFPTDPKAVRPALPGGMDIDVGEPEHPLRLRALVVEALERAACEGHTVVDAERIAGMIADLPLAKPISIDATALEICADEFAPEIAVEPDSPRLTAQLVRYVEARGVIAHHVNGRVGSGQAETDWGALVREQFGKPNEDDDEQSAQDEKVRALEVLERSRIGVLTGPAGTGKTTLLKIFLDQRRLVGREVQLLAPTGKARVRLGQQTKRPDQARTLAQFLLEHGRYDAATGRYLVVADGPTANVTTCVVDECSMLTEDQLAALCSALPLSARLILVGDPQQLPPIGAGRPFVDIIAHLKAEHDGAGLADLTVSRRQAGGGLVPALSLPDVQLANLFSGRAAEPGEDEILGCIEAGGDGGRLRLVSWDTPASLRERLIEVLAAEFNALPQELEAEVELSLGGTRNGDYIYFNRGCGESAEQWQILSAHRNMASGSAELNRFLKQTVRAARLESARRRGRGWRMIEPRGADQITYGDKVICLRNHRRNRWNPAEGRQKGYLANGEVGMVNGDAGSGRLDWTKVEFASQPGEVYSFAKRDFAEEGSPYLELAYSVTVHKAQGSEFGTVILVLPENSRLLTREMLYTALTRQKNRVWILHQGSFGQYLKLRSDFYAETKRRSTNLFGASGMRETTHLGPGGARTGWLAAKLIHATRRGDLVSSKSELIIADILHDLEKCQELRYSFEKPLTDAEGATRLPDFTIEKDQEVWYWEHCGLMGQPQYRERWSRKKDWYAAQGITVWSSENPTGRLIVTLDDANGGIDSGAIAALAGHLFAGSGAG